MICLLTANCVRKHLLVVVDNGERVEELVSVESVGHAEGEVEGVHCERCLVSLELEGDGILLLLDHSILGLSCEAVELHLVFVSFVCIVAVNKTPADGEKHASAACPIFFITLPEIFAVVCLGFDRHKLCAAGCDLDL